MNFSECRDGRKPRIIALFFQPQASINPIKYIGYGIAILVLGIDRIIAHW